LSSVLCWRRKNIANKINESNEVSKAIEEEATAASSKQHDKMINE